MIAVLSSLRSDLEDRLAAGGQDVLAIVPHRTVAARRASGRGYAVRGVHSWDDWNELAGLAYDLERDGVTVVVSFDERAVRAAAFLRDLLGLPGPSLASIIASTDKIVMKTRLREAGVLTADFRVLHSLSEVSASAAELGWPVVLKPRFGFSAINTVVVLNSEHLDYLRRSGAFDRPADGYGADALSASDALAPLGTHRCGFVVEAFVDIDDEYHCELLRHAGDDIYRLPFRYPAPLLLHLEDTVGSIYVPPGSKAGRAVSDCTSAAAAALGLGDGFAHCEVFYTRDGRWLVGEIAARPGGAQVPHSLKLQHGIDVTELMADLVIGRPLNPVNLMSESRPVAWLSVRAPRGRIVEMSRREDILRLPGVVDIRTQVDIGEVCHGSLGSLSHAAYVFCTGSTADEAERNARRATEAFVVAAEPP